MKLKKVKLIGINIYPTLQPYIRENEFFIDKKTEQYFRCECDHNNKKILLAYQPIRFSIINDEGDEVMSHEQIITSKINYELLDEVLDDGGTITTRHKLVSFDVGLCEMIISMCEGVCWVEQKESEHVIHLQDSVPITKRQIVNKRS